MIFENIRDYFLFFEEKILPELKQHSYQSPKGYHGLETHTYQVVFRAIDYAFQLHQDPMPVLFAAALHDCARIDDRYDVEHGLKALPLVRQILNRFREVISPSKDEAILRAIAQHTTGHQPVDYISACLWDADRTRLSWERGFDASYFSTEYAKKRASSDPRIYLNYQAQTLNKAFEDREGVLVDFKSLIRDIHIQSEKTFCLRHQYMLWGRRQPFKNLGIVEDLKRFLTKGVLVGIDGFYSYLCSSRIEEDMNPEKIYLFFNLPETKLQAPFFRLDHTACEIDLDKKGIESFYLMNQYLLTDFLPCLQTGLVREGWQEIEPISLNFDKWENMIYRIPEEAKITAIRLRNKKPYYYQYLLENKKKEQYIFEPEQHLMDGFSHKVAVAIEDALFGRAENFSKAYTDFIQNKIMPLVEKENWTCALVFRGQQFPAPERIIYKGYVLFDNSIDSCLEVANKITPAFLKQIEEKNIIHHHQLQLDLKEHSRS